MQSRLNLLQYAENHHIDVDYFPFGEAEAMSMPVLGSCAVAINPKKIKSVADETVKLAHELGHCVYSGFYSTTTPLDIKEKHEYRANTWAVRKVLPFQSLRRAFQKGICEKWELAEYFNVTEEFIDFALMYYIERCGLSLNDI